MSGYVVGSLIGVGATLVGSLLTGHRETRARREQRRLAGRADLSLAMSDYLAAVDAMTVELTDYPTTPKKTRLDQGLDRAVDRAGLQVVAFMFARVTRRLVHGQRPDQLVDRLAGAASRLRLIAPPGVDALMRELEAKQKTYQPGDKQWLEDWLVLRGRVRSAFRTELDQVDTERSGRFSVIRRTGH